MSTEQRIRAAVRELADAIEVAVPPAAAVRARAERPPVRARGRWLVPAAAAAAAAAVMVMAALAPGWLPEPVGQAPAEPVDRPVLPERFAGKNWRTATVNESPPGPAIAVFTHGTSRSVSEPVVVAADGRTYRLLDGGDYALMSSAHAEPLLLSPDGSGLAGTAGRILDLTTGEITWHRILASDTGSRWSVTTPLSWSPDGRWIAYGVPARAGLALLDTATGEVEIVATGDRSELQAAFSPDSSELAVSAYVDNDAERRATIRVYDLAGRLLRELAPPPGQLLSPHGTAWSPDGALLVTRSANRLSFVDATGAGAPVPAPVTLDGVPQREMISGQAYVLGWRGPDTMLVATGPRQVSEVPVGGGAPRTVSEFSIRERDRVDNLRLAGGLLAEAENRDAGRPARGPLPMDVRVMLAGAVALVLVAAGTVSLAWRRSRLARPG